MKTAIAIALMLPLLGCDIPAFTPPFKRYQLQNGQIIECRFASSYHTGEGINFSDCKDGNNYLAQNNVTELI